MPSRRTPSLARSGRPGRLQLRLRKVSDSAYNQVCTFLRGTSLSRTLAEPAPNGNKILSFSGDVEEEEGDDPAVDLFAEASKPDAESMEETGDGDGDGDGEDEAEPEDDFNAAWEVLDLARAIYEKHMEGDDEVRLKVADTFILLGDVSLETGAFVFFILKFHTQIFIDDD